VAAVPDNRNAGLPFVIDFTKDSRITATGAHAGSLALFAEQKSCVSHLK
jgi:hypothetical protein